MKVKIRYQRRPRKRKSKHDREIMAAFLSRRRVNMGELFRGCRGIVTEFRESYDNLVDEVSVTFEL